MKEIENASKEYADNQFNETHEQGKPSFYCVDLALAFKAGVEWATKWTDVNDELPEFGERVLVKSNTGSIGIAWLQLDTDKKRWYDTKTSSILFDCVKHWRKLI